MRLGYSFVMISFIYAGLCGISQADEMYQAAVQQNDGQVVIKNNAYAAMLNATGTSKENLPSARDMGIKSNGLRSGQQFGYADQLQYLQDCIQQKSASLDKIFNFKWLLGYASEGSPVVNVLPPVILKSHNYVQGGNKGRSITISDQYYQLYANARLVTVMPDWRDYLIHPIPAPEKIASWLLPQDSSEQGVWKTSFNAGWGLGVKQADEEMSYRISLLNRDFNGMLTYLRLYAEDKVSSPFVAYSQKSVSGDQTKMSINNRIYRITTPASLNTNPDDWKFQSQMTLTH